MHSIKEDSDKESEGDDRARKEDEHRRPGRQEGGGGKDSEREHEPTRYLVEGGVDVFESKVAEATKVILRIRCDGGRKERSSPQTKYAQNHDWRQPFHQFQTEIERKTQ